MFLTPGHFFGCSGLFATRMVFSCTKVRFWRRLPLWGWRSHTPAVSILPLPFTQRAVKPRPSGRGYKARWVKPVGVADAYRLRSFWSQKSVVDGAGRTDILIPVTIGREELLLVLVSFGAGLVAAILPALAAYRTK